MNEDELRALIRAAVQRHIPQAAAEGRVSTKLATIQASEVGLSFGQYHLERAAGRHVVPHRTGRAMQSLRFL